VIIKPAYEVLIMIIPKVKEHLKLEENRAKWD
jgi:hypothetical protein